MTKLMIYGAAGYTGRMAQVNAQAHRLNLIVAGRPKDEDRLIALREVI